MHSANIGIAAAGLILWRLARGDQGPLGTAVRGELGTVFIAVAGLGCLVYTLMFALDVLGLRRRSRQYQSAPRWLRAVTWIVLPVLSIGYGVGFAEQLGDFRPWPTNTAVAASLTATPAAKYPAAVRQHFLNSCITSGGTQSSCACSIDGIEARYTLKEFAAFDARAKSGESMPPELVHIVATCNATH